MDAGRRTINDIFTGNKILEIPFFQRAYVWNDKNWERFLEDAEYVCASKSPYFLGSLVLKQQMTTSASSVGDVRRVIDGQQRLTTISILMKVLSLKTSATNKFERRFKLDDGSLVLHHNRIDLATYNKIMNLEKLEVLQGEDKLTKAYQYFSEHADPAKLDFDIICTKLLFVGIDLAQEDDEQQIFDTINSLGVTLTTAELLKNFFFTENDISSYQTYWQEIFEKDEPTINYWNTEITTGRIRRTYIDVFFYAYLQIKIQDGKYGLNTEEKIAFSKFERLFESYKSFIKSKCNNNKLEMLKEIKEYAIIFRNSFSEDALLCELSHESGIERINAIIFTFDTTTLVPYVLYIEKNIQDTDTKNDLYDILEAYILRRVITRQTTKNYNRLFSERLIINQILSRDDFISYMADSDDVNNRIPTNDEVEKGFHESILVNKYAAGILYLLETKIRNQTKYSTQLLGVKKYSLEHLMPKNWRKHWKINTFDEDSRDKILLTLGNLTIITQSLNASIRDADWKTKKKGSGSKGGLKKYSEGLETLSDWLRLDIWNEESIIARANYLSTQALDIWNISKK